MNPLRLTEGWFHKHHNHAIREKWQHNVVDMRFKIGKQAETIAGLQCTKNKYDREAVKMHLCIQTQTETTTSLESGAKMVTTNSAALAENLAAGATLTSEPDSLQEAIPG